MSFRYRQSAPLFMAALLLWIATSHAGANLGMKLACRDFGHAWRSGSQHALAASVSDPLRGQLARLDESELRRLVAEASDSSGVIASSKYGGRGSVTVSTNRGPLRFDLAGRGFRWRITDVHSLDSRSQWVSLADRIDATCTARDFYRNLSDPATEFAAGRTTIRFRDAILALPAEQRTAARKSFARSSRWDDITCTIEPGKAQVTTRKDRDSVRFKLIRQRGAWQVDDVEVNCATLSVPSLRTSFDAYCALVSLGQGIRKPGSIRDFSFIRHSQLRAELQQLRDRDPITPTQSAALPKRKRLSLAEDGMAATYTDGAQTVQVRLMLDPMTRLRQIEDAVVQDKDGTRSLASTLALRRKWNGLAEAGQQLLLPVHALKSEFLDMPDR